MKYIRSTRWDTICNRQKNYLITQYIQVMYIKKIIATHCDLKITFGRRRIVCYIQSEFQKLNNQDVEKYNDITICVVTT